jgi:hypothetical protein
MTDNQREPQAWLPRCQSVAPLSLRVYQLAWDTFRIPLRADFHFEPEDPLAVTVNFMPRDQPPVTWRLSREALYLGCVEASGEGDVRIRPVRVKRRWMVRMRLGTLAMEALFEADLVRLEAWLEETYRLVPLGEELNGVDWDAVTAYLLGGA